MNGVEGSVRAIVCSHGHLGPYRRDPEAGAPVLNAPIISTPFTTELIGSRSRANRSSAWNNKLFALKAGQRYTLSPTLVLEFVRKPSIYHRHGYPRAPHASRCNRICCDFKLERTPVIGEPPDFARLRQIGKEGVLAVIVESTNITLSGRCPSERIARDLVPGYH